MASAHGPTWCTDIAAHLLIGVMSSIFSCMFMLLAAWGTAGVAVPLSASELPTILQYRPLSASELPTTVSPIVSFNYSLECMQISHSNFT